MKIFTLVLSKCYYFLVPIKKTNGNIVNKNTISKNLLCTFQQPPVQKKIANMYAVDAEFIDQSL